MNNKHLEKDIVHIGAITKPSSVQCLTHWIVIMNVLRTRISLALQDLIEEQNGIAFQRLAYQCLHVRYPSLMATAVQADLGEDGITVLDETSDDGVIRSLACSLTANLSKILEDAKKIKARRSDVEELIFATPKKVERRTITGWEKRINSEFGWKLVVVEREELLNILESPDLRWICIQHLNVHIWEDCLKIPKLRWDDRLYSAGAMLRPEFSIVPFRGRKREIDDLTRWAMSNIPLSIRLYAGWAGFGKTRLAMEICHRLRQSGVRAGFIIREDVDTFIEDFATDSKDDGSTLFIVIDYVESNRDVLVNLLKRFERNKRKRIRFMLLARGVGEWWEELKRVGNGVGELLSGPATAKPIRITSLALSQDERKDSYNEAFTAFAKELKISAPKNTPSNLNAPYYERVLLLHMSALLDVTGEARPTENEKEDEKNRILCGVLNKEIRFWERLLLSRKLDASLLKGLDSAMATFTMIDGVWNKKEAVELLQRLPHFEEENWRILDILAELIHDSYSGSEKYIEPLQPDLLGDHLIRSVLTKHGEEFFDKVLM